MLVTTATNAGSIPFLLRGRSILILDIHHATRNDRMGYVQRLTEKLYLKCILYISNMYVSNKYVPNKLLKLIT